MVVFFSRNKRNTMFMQFILAETAMDKQQVLHKMYMELTQKIPKNNHQNIVLTKKTHAKLTNKKCQQNNGPHYRWETHDVCV